MGKNKNNRKLDLSHLASLNQSVPPEPLETLLEPPKASIEESTPPPIQAEPPNKPTPMIIPAQPQPEPASTPVEEAPAFSQAQAPTNRRYFDKRPQRKEIKPLKTLENTTNAAQEVFQSGDKIVVKAPWGGKALAEITLIYQDESGNAWVHYLPVESVPPDWNWFGGCTRSRLLVKA